MRGALLGTVVVLGLARLWDASIPLGWEAAGFLALVGTAFALRQAAVVRWLGLRGVAVGLPFLMAPSVGGLVPELINPVYRALLWSWTPFRFSSEGLRGLLFFGSGAPDVQIAPRAIGMAAKMMLGLSVCRAEPSSMSSATYGCRSANLETEGDRRWDGLS